MRRHALFRGFASIDETPNTIGCKQYRGVEIFWMAGGNATRNRI